MDADVPPLVPSSPSDAVLEIDPETYFKAELNNITNIVIDTECITTINNSDCYIQNSVTNNARTQNSVQNVSFDSTCQFENLSEAKNCCTCRVDNSLLDSTLPVETLSDHTPVNLSQENWFKEKGLNIMHMNIHYLYPKLDELKILSSRQTNTDVLCICETFLNDTFSDSEIQL